MIKQRQTNRFLRIFALNISLLVFSVFTYEGRVLQTDHTALASLTTVLSHISRLQPERQEAPTDSKNEVNFMHLCQVIA